MRTFPGEEIRSAEVQHNLAPYFTLAERIQNFWLTQEKDEWMAKSKLSAFVTNVAGLLDIQALRQFRSIVEESRRCEGLNANIIARSMFETVMAQRFILAKRLCIVVEPKLDNAGNPVRDSRGATRYRARIPSKNARPKKTDWLSRELRANLYWTHRAFQDLRALDRLSTGKRMKKKTQTLKDGVGKQIADECANDIGPEWTSILKESDTYSGLSIADLAKVLFKGFGRWQQTIYFFQCQDAHATNARQHLAITEGRAKAVFHSTDRMISQVLWPTLSLALINIKLMQNNVYFGPDVDIALESLQRAFYKLRKETPEHA